MGLTERQQKALDGIRRYYGTIRDYEKRGRTIKGKLYQELRAGLERDVAVLLGYQPIETWYELRDGITDREQAEATEDASAVLMEAAARDRAKDRERERTQDEAKTMQMGRPKEIRPETEARAREMRAQGYSYGVIAARLGIGKSTAYKLAKGTGCL